MKISLQIVAIAFSVNAFAQPVILNGDNIPAPGIAVPVSFGTPTVGVDNAGADQTWDFSAISFTTAGTLTTIDPANSAFAASFPAANYAYSVGNTYSYFKASATQMEVLAYSITNPGSGNDFSPNPRTALKFPFHYTNTLSDTWQTVGGSTNSVTITYDAYGTLITPTKTYSNVVRVKEEYNSGADYQWYILSPLMSIAVYDHNSNAIYLTDAGSTGISEQTRLQLAVDVYPNPTKDKLLIQLSESPLQNDWTLNVVTVTGKIIKQVSVRSELTEISLENIPAGIYYYQLRDMYKTLQTGKIIIQ